jgi:Golgi SNAP receptor complex protein 1
VLLVVFIYTHKQQHSLNQLQQSINHRGGASSGMRPRAEILLREKNALHSSLQLTDDTIEQALNARNRLNNQTTMFGQISGKIKDVGGRFPQVNNLITRIQRSKQRDMLVMACVIASCMCFTIFYWLRKE